jgi:hypothetical protein
MEQRQETQWQKSSRCIGSKGLGRKRLEEPPARAARLNVLSRELQKRSI